MARSRTPEIASAKLSIDQLKAAIPKLDRRINDLESFDVRALQERWDPAVEALAQKTDGTLQEILGHGTIEYNEYPVGSLDTLPLSVIGGGHAPAEIQKGYSKGIARAVAKLRTLKSLFEERIADAVAQSPGGETSVQSQKQPDSRRVFVVHGHDDGAKETVARFLAQLNLQPVILHEQPNQGKTVIEKIEANSDVAFAIVIFTADDIGHPAAAPEKAAPRARQNVVLELGFFMSSLGRHRVCVLYENGVEVPSDYAGVVYVPFDDGGAWRLLVARELKAAGVEIDLNRAL